MDNLSLLIILMEVYFSEGFYHYSTIRSAINRSTRITWTDQLDRLDVPCRIVQNIRYVSKDKISIYHHI